MNGSTLKKKKPRKCMLTESQLAEFAELMKQRFFSHKELVDMLKERYAYNSEISYVLNHLDMRGWMVAQEERPSKTGFKNYYKVVTVQDYEKIAEEHRENAYRRCLEKTS